MPSRPNYLLSVDPGLATGAVLIDVHDPENPVPVWDAELTIQEFYAMIEHTIENYGTDLAIVWEDFHITVETAKKTPQPWSLHLIGVMLYFCWKYDIPCAVQSPVRKGFATNDKLRHVGFWHKGDHGHANDAFRHAMIYLVDNYPNWARKLILPTK
jgi:hypothetical protein